MRQQHLHLRHKLQQFCQSGCINLDYRHWCVRTHVSLDKMASLTTASLTYDCRCHHFLYGCHRGIDYPVDATKILYNPLIISHDVHSVQLIYILWDVNRNL